MTRQITRYLLLSAALATAPAWAVNRCVGPYGQVTYQQAECPGATAAPSSQTTIKPPIKAGQGSPTANKNLMTPEEIAKAFEAQEEAQKSGVTPTRSNGEVNWQKVRESVEEKERTPSVVRIGMSAADVRSSWGNPRRVNTTTTAGGTSEQWIYYRGQHRTQYVYLTNGLVTSTQTVEH